MIKKLWIAEWKQYCRQLPRVLAASILLLLLGGCASFACVKLLYSDAEALQTKAAIVTDDPDNVYLDFILQILQGEGGEGSYHVTYLFMDEQEAYEALRKQAVAAVFLFPEGAVEGILNGTNTPIRVVFGNKNDMAAILLRETVTTLGSLLSSAQAGTYTTSSVFASLGCGNLLTDAFQKVDTIHFSYVFSRGELFEEIPVTFGAASSITLYYAASLLLFLLLLSGIGFSAVLSFEPNAFYRAVRSRGITAGNYYALRFLSYQCFSFACLLLLTLASIPLSGIAASKFNFISQLRFSGYAIVMLLLFSMFLSAFALFLTAIAPSPSLGILFTFLLSAGLLICSGGFLPSAFLPEALRETITCFPTYVCHQAVIFLLSGQNLRPLFQTDAGFTQSLLYLIPCSAVLYAAGLGILHIRLKNK